MPSLADAATRTALIARVNALQPNATPKWGKMNAPQMLAHCADALRMAYGDVVCTPKNSPLLSNGIVKRLLIGPLPWPKGAPTAKELISRAPSEWGAERQEVIGLIERFDRERTRTTWPDHPAFGALDGELWGKLAAKHLNHHFTQFGV